jgi:hypothetical protein
VGDGFIGWTVLAWSAQSGAHTRRTPKTLPRPYDAVSDQGNVNATRMSVLELWTPGILLRKPAFFAKIPSMGLSKTQQAALERIRRARLQPQPRTSEEAYGQMRRMVAAQKSSGSASSTGPAAKG